MLSITHAAVGGAAAKFIPNPLLAFLAGIVSHLIIDKVVHYWPKEKNRQDLQIKIDTYGSILILIMIYFISGYSFNILAGALGGVVVDLVLVVIAKRKKEWWNHPIRRWHEDRQPHKTNRVYLSTDIIQTIIGLAIIYFVR